MIKDDYAATAGARRERLETRVSREQKELFQRAASLQGYTLSEFVVHTLQEAALRTIKETEVLVLGAKDREVFFDALLNPPEPNDALRRAVEEYRRIMQA